jgi:hypothetical protein
MPLPGGRETGFVLISRIGTLLNLDHRGFFKHFEGVSAAAKQNQISGLNNRRAEQLFLLWMLLASSFSYKRPDQRSNTARVIPQDLPDFLAVIVSPHLLNNDGIAEMLPETEP